MTARRKWLIFLRSISWIAAAIPALGLCSLLMKEAVSGPGGLSINLAFHVVLAISLLALFSEFAVTIGRCRDPRVLLALGTGGFMAIILMAVLSELLGPAVLLALLIVIVLWGARLHRSGRLPRLVEPALPRRRRALCGRLG